jgi:hypothetical protein
MSQSSEPAFDNVPDWLTEKVKRLAISLDPRDRESVYLNAAGWVIAQYLGMDVTAADADQFFGPKPADENGFVPHATVNKVILVGDTIFGLRSSPGFREFCRRMTTRDLRPHFLELLQSKTFFKAGYEIDARRETGVKGDDFDFVAGRDDETINVEVTALKAPAFSVRTVRNALDAKRKQVPDSQPAAIFCIVPESWFTGQFNLNSALGDVAVKFLAGTRRINFVVFVMEKHLESESGRPGGALIILRDPYENLSPRIPIKNPEFFRSGRQVSISHGAVLTDAVINELEPEANTSEFFRWVDYLVPKLNPALVE